MKASDLMTNELVTVPATASIRDAMALLRSKEIRHLPVLGTRGELVGIVSDRDVRDVAIGYALTEDTEFDDAVLDEPITKVMQADLVTCEADTSVSTLIDLMLETKVGAVPVIDKRSRDVLGIVSYIDLLRTLRKLVS